MTNTKKFLIFFALLFITLMLNSNYIYADEARVTNEEDLRNAITNAQSGQVINLGSNIALTSPIEIVEKDITINGNGFAISKVDENWSPDGQNGSLITIGLEGSKLTLTNITLRNAQKYGAQSYNGAHLTLDGVTVENCGYGGILVNAGTVEVKNLVLHRNGNPNNNGIELAKGSSITTGDNVPTLVMNGTLSSSEPENVLYVAINDKLSGFELVNEESSENKIFVEDNMLVVTDKNNNIIFKSSELDEDLNFTAQEYKPNNTTELEKDNTPKTGTNYIFEVTSSILILSVIGLVVLNKRKN